MRAYRTVLEEKISERSQTVEEFAEFAETFARDHGEAGTLSARHLQRLVSGRGPQDRPLGRLRPPTARLLERIFNLSIDELLAPPDRSGPRIPPVRSAGPLVVAQRSNADPEQLASAFRWLDSRAGWIPATSQRRVRSRLARVDVTELLDRRTRRARNGRRRLGAALSEYYADRQTGYDQFQARCGEQSLTTGILTRPGWLALGCRLTPQTDRLTLALGTPSVPGPPAAGVRNALQRLVEMAALDVRAANSPVYRLTSVEVGSHGIGGTVEQADFIEYALTVDLLEAELADAVLAGVPTRAGHLPLRDAYLSDRATVVDLARRSCFGGVLALCAIARPADPYRGEADYALLVQERSPHVLNAAGRLSVIPKSFHQPLTDPRADVSIAATLHREMEEELFGRTEVDSTATGSRAAAPMHPSRLSAPMRWLLGDGERLRLECTGFGFNLMSGNYEFACLVVIDDEEFWERYGGHIEANWETSGMRVYSSRDRELVCELVSSDAWTDEGLFAFLMGIQRLIDADPRRVDLPTVEI